MLKLPKSSLSLAGGGKGRIKTVHAAGDDVALRHALARLCLALDLPPGGVCGTDRRAVGRTGPGSGGAKGSGGK